MNDPNLPMFKSEEDRTVFFESIKNKPFTVTDPSGVSADFYPPDPGPAVETDKVDRHRRYQAFAMYGCKSLWKEEYASMRRPDVIAALAGNQNHPAVPKVIACLRTQHEVEATLGELPAVGALKDAVEFFVHRKGRITVEADYRDKAKAVVKRHQGEIARHELAMSAYAKSAVEAGVLKPYTAYQAGDYVLVVLPDQGSDGYYVQMMPLEKST